MLVLSRYTGETVVIDGPCRVTVISSGLTSGKVRLGFEAEPSVRIDREEVDERRKAEGNSDVHRDH